MKCHMIIVSAFYFIFPPLRKGRHNYLDLKPSAHRVEAVENHNYVDYPLPGDVEVGGVTGLGEGGGEEKVD